MYHNLIILEISIFSQRLPMFEKNLVTVHGLFETQNSKHQRSIKSQITNTKLQLNLKFQAPNLKQISLRAGGKLQIPNRFKVIVFLFGILNFGHCNLFVFWDLLFGISTNSFTP